MDKEILKKWLTAGYAEKGAQFPTVSGTPQGGISSPALLVITLSGLEQAVKAATSTRDKAHVSIYADDFIITAANEQIIENKVKPAVEAFLLERGLTLSKEKTRITHINQGFDFLGANIRKYNGKLIMKPAKDSVKRFLADIKETTKKNATAKTENLIHLLNPKIRGWTNYHRHLCAKKTFSYVSHRIFITLWNWAKRRHPGKGHRWIKNKYFRHKGYQNWIFSTKTKDKKGNSVYLELIDTSAVSIQRHVKIRADATPYDPAFQDYLRERNQRPTTVKKLGKPIGRSRKSLVRPDWIGE
jgi:RNA-directed DNA polymerase